MRNVLTYEGVPVPRQEHSRGTRRVVEVDPRTDPRYEAFVVNHPRALIYHHPAWLEVLARENFVRPICLACEDGGRLTGILPLFATRGLPFGRQLTGRRLSSLPRTPVAGPLALNAGAAAALLRDAKNRAAERPAVTNPDTRLIPERGPGPSPRGDFFPAIDGAPTPEGAGGSAPDVVYPSQPPAILPAVHSPERHTFGPPLQVLP